jgi:hypothetical protein
MKVNQSELARELGISPRRVRQPSMTTSFAKPPTLNA